MQYSTDLVASFSNSISQKRVVPHLKKNFILTAKSKAYIPCIYNNAHDDAAVHQS